MKKLITFIAVIFLVGCNPDAKGKLGDEMEPHLKDSMIKRYGPKGVIITEVTLVHKSGDLYGGFGECEYKGELVNLTFHVTVVDGGYKWNAEPVTTDEELIEIFKKD